jgi:hypothetical protein
MKGGGRDLVLGLFCLVWGLSQARAPGSPRTPPLFVQKSSSNRSLPDRLAGIIRRFSTLREAPSTAELSLLEGPVPVGE